MIKIINIVDSIEDINIGIWDAALSTSEYLLEKYKIQSEIWYPAINGISKNELLIRNRYSVKVLGYEMNYKKKIQELVKPHYNPKNTIVVSHGCWRSNVLYSFWLMRIGFLWIYTPHGMLEPWAMKQKPLRKWFIYNIKEKFDLKVATVIRAVSNSEHENLVKRGFKHCITIPNGTKIIKNISPKNFTQKLKFLFLGRLHHKKGVVPLAKGWINSQLANNQNYELVIAGPDQGEKIKLNKIQQANNCNNLIIRDGVYGEDKVKLLSECHFFALPSHSEGFPTSVVEAMQYGLIPLISNGCNFPDAFENELAINFEPDEKQIANQLNKLQTIDIEYFQKLSNNCRKYIIENYSIEHVAELQYKLYIDLLKPLKS